jgi:hypothetical protein
MVKNIFYVCAVIAFICSILTVRWYSQRFKLKPKIKKDEIDLKILFSAFDTLQDIEEGKIDQHEGAYKFGMLLKKIYVDSALKKAEKLNATTGEVEAEYKGPQVEISWKQFKKMQ